QPLRHREHMMANRDSLKGLINREDVLQELDGQAVGHQGGPLGLQIEQLRGGAFWQQGSQGTKAHGGVRLTWTMGEARTLDRECPEDLLIVESGARVQGKTRAGQGKSSQRRAIHLEEHATLGVWGVDC